MAEKNRENLEKRIEKNKAEIKSLRETIVSLKEESANLKRSLKNMETIFHSIPAGVALIQGGKILKINGEISEQLGYGADEIIGRGFLDFIHQDQWEYVKKIHNTWDSGRLAPEEYDACLLSCEGDPIECEIKVRRIRFKGRRAFLLILNRLEKRKEKEEEMIQEKKREALITMGSGMIRKFRNYNDFLLNKIKDLLVNAFPEGDNMEAAINILEEASGEAPSIVSDLEVIGEMQRERKDMIPFDLNETVREAVESINRKLNARSKGLNAAIDLKTYLRATSFVKGNPGEIMDVMIHMITNAVEAMPHGGEIHITTEDNAGYVHIYIQDSGVGIPIKYSDRIFDPFFGSKGEDSTGLGLSLSKAIIERHGGGIEMSSMEGQWTIFHVRLPPAKGVQETRPKADKKRIKDAQILIIQQEDIARELLSHLLSSKGCKVDTANDSLEGLGKIKRHRYNLVIADIETFLSDGNSLVKKCTKIDPKMSIALIKGVENRKDIGPQDEPGVDLYIRKPLDVNIVVQQISELLMRR